MKYYLVTDDGKLYRYNYFAEAKRDQYIFGGEIKKETEKERKERERYEYKETYN